MPHSGAPLDGPVQIGDLLRRGLVANPANPAIVSMDEAWTWAELEAATNRLAANYLALGLQQGDRVASLMPNRLALLAHYIACLKAGLVTTPLNYRYTAPEIDHALGVSGAKIILAHAERAKDIAASKAASLPLGVITYGAEKGGGRSLEALLEIEPPPTTLPALDPEAPAVIFFTSGSTGPAKGVTHSVNSLGWLIAAAAAAFEMTADDIVLPASSCSHIGGFGLSLSALSVGAQAVVARSLDHAELGPLMRERRPTFLSMLPAALLSLVREEGTTADDFSSLRLARSGGDKVPSELEKEFRALTGHLVSEGYGLTETGLAARNPPSGLDKLGSIGLPSPGFDFCIRGEDGKEVATGEEGRVWIKTRTEMAGYWNDPQATAEVNRDGWFDTGDVCRRDADGFYYFVGRTDDMFVCGGENVYPGDVEGTLERHPDIQQAAVLPVDHELKGQVPVAFVVARPGAGLTEQAVKEWALAHGPAYQHPRRVFLVPELPLAGTNKIDRAALKARALATPDPSGGG